MLADKDRIFTNLYGDQPWQLDAARPDDAFAEVWAAVLRALLCRRGVEQMRADADEAVRKHLSVEQLEDLVFNTNVPLQKQEGEQHRARWVDPNVRAAQTEMERALGMRVRIRDRKGKGKIVIEYATLEDFDRVVEMLKGKNQDLA